MGSWGQKNEYIVQITLQNNIAAAEYNILDYTLSCPYISYVKFAAGLFTYPLSQQHGCKFLIIDLTEWISLKHQNYLN